MNQNIQKWSILEHKELKAISFCQECKIYKCNNHQELFKRHNQMKLSLDISELITALCKINNHYNELTFLCKTHNKLCYPKCITKIKGKENGQHTNCNVCFIEDIENEKKVKLQENLKYLKNLSIINQQQSTIELKKN